MTTQERNKALIREITEVIWNQRQLDRVGEFYSTEYVADYRPYSPERKGLDAIRGMVERAHAAFPDYHEELRELIADGDFVAVGITISGMHRGDWGGLPPTGKRVEINEIVILEIRDGKVVRQRGVADNLAALRQLGVIPPRPGDPAAN